jgi:hypothetical protein
MLMLRIVLIFNLLLLPQAYADFSVTINKQVHIEKEQKVIAKIDGEQKIIEGLLKATPSIEKANILVVDISWIAILDQKSRINVSNLYSNIELDKNFLTRGTSLLVKGSLPNDVKLKTQEEKKEDKKRDIPATNNGTTSISTGGVNSPVGESSLVAEIERPEYITTYDGCEQLFNQKEEAIHAYQQIYYIDKDGTKVITQPCTKVKDFPALRQTCDIFHDFTNKVSYKRFQPYFVEEEKQYGAGGCVPYEESPHLIDFSTCQAQAVGSTFIKKGQWYYSEKNGDKVYISGCVLDPEGTSKELKVKFEGCPLSHDLKTSQSTHLGKYYWIKPDNTLEFLGDCVVTKESSFSHILDWNSGNAWQHDNTNGFSQRIMTRYILIASENNRKIIINDKELDAVKYPHSTIFNGYKYYDDKNRSSPTGHDTRLIQTIVKFGTQQFFTGKNFEEGYLSHKKISFISIRNEKCGSSLQNKKRFYYQDKIERTDKSTYFTNTYDTGCS